jgi:uncharacterized membrane protein YhhN
LRTLLLLFVVLGSSLGVFGAWGIVVFGLVIAAAACIAGPDALPWQTGPAIIVLLCLLLAIASLSTSLHRVALDEEERRFNWPNIAALAVWLLSVGVLLTCAVRSRKRLPVPATPPAAVQTRP